MIETRRNVSMKGNDGFEIPGLVTLTKAEQTTVSGGGGFPWEAAAWAVGGLALSGLTGGLAAPAVWGAEIVYAGYGLGVAWATNK